MTAATSAWLKQARRIKFKRTAWVGMDRCTQPKQGRGSCDEAGKPHRHCECGVAIDLDHGYCDDCLQALVRGAAMTRRQSIAMEERRLRWLERFSYVTFERGHIRVLVPSKTTAPSTTSSILS